MNFIGIFLIWLVTKFAIQSHHSSQFQFYLTCCPLVVFGTRKTLQNSVYSVSCLLNVLCFSDSKLNLDDAFFPLLLVSNLLISLLLFLS